MERFYKDGRTAEEISAAYVGKNMGQIQEEEWGRFEEKRPEIDALHDAWLKGRSRMLTVGKLVEWLKKQDQDACVLAFEPNSDAFIEQFPDLPSPDVCTAEQCRADMEKNLRQWYRDTEGAEEKIKRELDAVFRYSKPGDVVIRFD